jgi:four helix bundle protein
VEEKKQYDLEERTLRFSKNVIDLINKASKNLSNNEIVKQLIRSAGSVGANYIEANEALGRKDFIMHARIARKEAKETRYWLQLLDCSELHQPMKERLIQESTELLKILSRIIEKSS